VLTVPVRFAHEAALEYLEYDASVLRKGLSLGGVAAGRLLWLRRDKALAFKVLSRVHRSAGSQAATRVVERLLTRAGARERSGDSTGLWSFYDAHVRSAVADPGAAAIVANPAGLLNYRALVVKSATDRERGVLVIDYSYIFPLFAALYDVEAIARRYYLVLEPSWRGLCTADVLAYSRYAFPVFVETVEPRDTAFLAALQANFVPVPIAANWWVDHRIVRPDPAVARDIDVVMVAAWSSVKRHWRFFRALADLRRRGHRLRVALLGYPLDRTRAQIEEAAQAFGIRDQIELHDNLPLARVVDLLTRAKVHVLWSRKEGANRAIVEALFADVPVIAREGLSYGFPYPYINPSTGRFASEQNLGNALLDAITNRARYEPRKWALAHMSCQRATEILEERIRATAVAAGERWTAPLAVKTVQLDSQRYWDPSDRDRFEDDYAFLKTTLRSRHEF
jgi:glycosyltransferase involved in cell wall biosynthesis